MHPFDRLTPGMKVYTRVITTAKSNMSATYRLYVVLDNEIVEITGSVARALGENVAKDGGIRVSGSGLNRGFDLVSRLGYAMWPEGTPEPHGTRNGKPDYSGDYALKQESL